MSIEVATPSPIAGVNKAVTDHFLLSDFICPCCDMIKITPGFYKHVDMLEQLRRQAGWEIAVSSGYRCRVHNKEIGGAPRSWHLLFATDIMPQDSDLHKLHILYELARDTGFTGIGRYTSHLHLDIRPDAMEWIV